MADNVLRLYQDYCLKVIVPGLQALTGKPKAVVLDEAQYKANVVERIWAALPLPIRLIGRGKLRWDDFFAKARSEVFHADSAGKLLVRPDAAFRLEALATRILPQPVGAPYQAPLAVPVAMNSKTPSPTVQDTAAPAPRASVSRVAASPGPALRTSPTHAAEKEAEMPAPAIGIDLGTTYSVVAYLDAHGRPTSVSNSVGEIVTPSVVLFDEAGPVVGKEAVLASAMEPERIAECVKRDMGSRFFRKKVNGDFMPPEVISSVILRSLKADAERKLGPVKNAVITVPAYFDESRRQATVDAGRMAGLNVLDIINEPTAAAIAYGYQLGFLDPKGLSGKGTPLRVLVFDLGGGTFDVTIVEIAGNAFKALATDGDVALGGKDWDETIVHFAAEKFIAEHREDPRANPSSLQDLWLNAELAKKTLTERPKATMFVNHLGTRMKVEITREQFEEMTAPLLGRTRTTTEIVVRQAGLLWSTIDKCLLVGGSTRVPQVVRMLKELTGKEPERSVAVDEAVAHGAALYANLLVSRQASAAAKSKTAERFTVTNINSHSLGIAGVDSQTGRRRTQVLIPKNTPLPHTATRVFKTQKAGQPYIVIRVVEGESERPEACIQIGACKIDNLPPNLPAGTPVHISYAYQSSGQLKVTALVEGVEASATTLFQRENQMNADDIALWTRYVQS